MKTKFKTIEEMPIILTVEQCGEVLGIGRVKAYELAKVEGFPVLLLGKRKLVPKHLFIKWIDEQTAKGCN